MLKEKLTQNELSLINYIRNSDNPAKALMVAIEVISNFLLEQQEGQNEKDNRSDQ